MRTQRLKQRRGGVVRSESGFLRDFHRAWSIRATASDHDDMWCCTSPWTRHNWTLVLKRKLPRVGCALRSVSSTRYQHVHQGSIAAQQPNQ